MTDRTPIQSIGSTRLQRTTQAQARAIEPGSPLKLVIEVPVGSAVSDQFLAELPQAAEVSLKAFPRPVQQILAASNLTVQVGANQADLLDLDSLFPEGQADESLVILGHMFYAWLSGKALPQEPRDVKAMAGVRTLLTTQKAQPVDLLTDINLLKQAAHCYFSLLFSNGNLAPIHEDSRKKRLNVSEESVRQQIFQAGLPATTAQSRLMRLSRHLNLAFAGVVDDWHGKAGTGKAFSEQPDFRRAMAKNLNQLLDKRIKLTRTLPFPRAPRFTSLQLAFPARVALPIHYDESYRELLASLGGGGMYQTADIHRHFPDALAVIQRQLGLGQSTSSNL